MEYSVLEQANFGAFDPNNPLYRHGADLSHANLTGAQTGGAHHLDTALTQGTIGLHR
jgi:uncharacterized protein YjbI with pentapeptide repeats